MLIRVFDVTFIIIVDHRVLYSIVLSHLYRVRVGAADGREYDRMRSGAHKPRPDESVSLRPEPVHGHAMREASRVRLRRRHAMYSPQAEPDLRLGARPARRADARLRLVQLDRSRRRDRVPRREPGRQGERRAHLLLPTELLLHAVRYFIRVHFIPLLQLSSITHETHLLHIPHVHPMQILPISGARQLPLAIHLRVLQAASAAGHHYGRVPRLREEHRVRRTLQRRLCAFRAAYRLVFFSLVSCL